MTQRGCPRGDQFAIASVDEAVEEGLREELVGLSPRYAVFLGQGEGFGHRLDRGPEQEVAREFDHVGGARLIARPGRSYDAVFHLVGK